MNGDVDDTQQGEYRAICLGKQEGRDFQFAHGCWKSRGRLGVSKTIR